MELAKIENLLEAYFEGNTTLDQEQELRAFFNTKEIPPHLAVYKPMFKGFELSKEETSKREITIAEPKRNKRFWSYSIAASLLIAIGVVGYTIGNSGLTVEEKEALAAFEKTKETMFLLSKNLNEGTATLSHLNEFSNGIANMAVLNQFNESKNLILK